MRIIFYEWKSFGTEDILPAFEEAGIEVVRLPFSKEYPDSDERVEAGLVKGIQENEPDFVFTFNYFPILALACKQTDTKYVSWIYDSPMVRLYSYTTMFPTNYIFIFDKELYFEFAGGGLTTVYYLPLAANTKRLSGMKANDEKFTKSKWCNQRPVAFIGALYNEKHNFYDRLEGNEETTGISQYTRGYLEGILAAQRKVYGYNFMEQMLTAEVVEDMHRLLPMSVDPSYTNSLEYLFAQYVLARELTRQERKEYLSAVSEQFGLDLYTHDTQAGFANTTNHGPVDYYDMAPYVFKNAKINLNISLRSIKSGIPLRCYDILGAGGFLLTNFQADFLDDFIPGEDYVFFENKQDMLAKTAYYLEHEEERATIAANGFAKVNAAHTYEHRVKEILEIVM